MPTIEIRVKAPTNRENMGTLQVIDATGITIFGPVNAYLLADRKTAISKGNASRDPLKPFGNTPLGSYDVTGFAPATPQRSNLGPNGSLRLNPTGGDALQAKVNGRTGLLIHGGKLGSNNKLRPTNGCIRLSDGDMSGLVNLYNTLVPPLTCSINSFTLDVVTNAGDIMPEGIDDGDPPIEIPAGGVVFP